MTDHMVTTNLSATSSYGYVGLSQQKATAPNSMIGSQQLENGLKGFGSDALPQFTDALLIALHRAEFDPKPHPMAGTPTQENGSAIWEASVNSFLNDVTDATYSTLTELCPPSVFTAEKKLADLQQFTHAVYVTPFRNRLIAQLTPTSFNLKYLDTKSRSIIPNPIWHEVPGWRYKLTAEAVWYTMGPHLRTTEMINPNAVWRLLVDYFWKIQSLRDVSNTTQAGRADYPSFILAIYEQTIRLLHEQWHRTELYQTAISHRPTKHSHDILRLPPRESAHVFVQTEEFDEAQRVRIMAYNDLLLHTLANCHAALLNCD